MDVAPMMAGNSNSVTTVGRHALAAQSCVGSAGLCPASAQRGVGA